MASTVSTAGGVSLTNVNMGVGALMALGGALGYSRARSMPSLVAGVTAGSLLMLAGYLQTGSNADVGTKLATGTALAVFAVMTLRAVRTGKLMPAGAVALLCAGTVYVNAVQL